MGLTGWLTRSGQTITLTRQAPTGQSNEQGVPITAPTTLATDMPCLAQQQFGREIVTATGTRAVADWDIFIAPRDPAGTPLPDDAGLLTLKGGRQVQVNILAVDDEGGAGDHLRLVAQSGWGNTAAE